MAGPAKVFDIFVRRAKVTKGPNRPRGRRQELWREEQAGPISLRLSLQFYKSSDRQHRLVERSWRIYCRRPIAVSYFRERLRALLHEMDRLQLVDGDLAEPPHLAEPQP